MKLPSNIIVQNSNNGISRVKLNEPETYNALSSKMLKSLIECFKNFDKDEKTKVIIIEGLGKGFSAGHNLKEINSLTRHDNSPNIRLMKKHGFNIVRELKSHYKDTSGVFHNAVQMSLTL